LATGRPRSGRKKLKDEEKAQPRKMTIHKERMARGWRVHANKDSENVGPV